MKVLVARCDRLGDLVLSLPALAWLRRARPDWEIHALVSPGAEPVVENDPSIDAYYTWDLALSDERRAQLAVERYDAAVLLQYQTPLARLLRDVGIRRRHGPLSKPASLFLLNRGTWQRRSRKARHEAEYNLDLMRSLVRRTDVPVEPPRVHLGPEQREFGVRFRQRDAGDPDVLVFVHPGSGGSALDWSPARFARVANELSRRPGWRVVVTGSHHDRLTIDQLAPELEPQVAVVAERFPLRDFLGVLSAGDLMIAPSTGPLHLGAALGLAAVGIYPPAPTMSPRRWGPRGPWATALVPPVDCPARRYCLQERCLLHNCLDGVMAGRVIDEAIELVARRQRERRPDDPIAIRKDGSS
jgi:ADP-heptose:LPS heptosyltransferase